MGEEGGGKGRNAEGKRPMWLETLSGLFDFVVGS